MLFVLLQCSNFLYASDLLWLSFCFSSNIYMCVSVCPSLTLTWAAPLQILHAKTTKKITQSWVVSSLFMQKLPGIFFFICPEHRAGLDLDGDFFTPVLSAVIAVVLYWADMMPSHSMDLPVPRGTSMLMLGGWHDLVHKLQCRCFVGHSKYVSMTNFCFSHDGKYSLTAWQITFFCECFMCVYIYFFALIQM